MKIKDSGLDPVDLVTGSFFITMTDYIAKDIGEDFVIQRNYESIYENTEQPLGTKWLLNLSSHLVRQEDKVTILREDHKKEEFIKEDGRWENKTRQGPCAYFNGKGRQLSFKGHSAENNVYL